MKKNKTAFICNECGFTNPKWLGKCPQCNNWNTFSELINPQSSQKTANFSPVIEAVSLHDISLSEQKRQLTDIRELDRVLGGGLVQGSSVLLGGEPGIGKSTLLLQVALNLAKNGLRVLYASGEENAAQVRIRAERLGSISESLYFLATSQVETIKDSFTKIKPHLLIVDSIQTCQTKEHPSGPGSIAQVRESAYLLSELVHHTPISGKQTKEENQNGALIMTAHITKEGSIAGPKILEHLVDCVLYFEGERLRQLRMVRAFKNRFGAINEIGLFQMTGIGLQEVENPTNYFLNNDHHSPSPGSVLVPVKEGSLILLIEVQSLVNEILNQVPKRASDGVDMNKVQLMTAVLDKIGGLNLRNSDIYIKIPGGVNIDDPALDLGVLVSLASSLNEKIINPDTCVMGEVSLSGDIRPVSVLNQRLKALEGLKIKKVIIPESQYSKELTFNGTIIPVKNIREVLEIIF